MDQAIVHVVPTLHQYHAAAPGYGFDTLTRVLEHLRPDVLVVELTDSALRQRRPQRVKQEYQNCVFPYLERHGIDAVAMEPGEPLSSELVERGLEAEKLYQSLWPERYVQYERATIDAFQALLRSWDSPAAVNSERTDQALQEKHARESELFGPDYKQTWDRWNELFAQTIAATAQRHGGRRVVALAGVEHSYWLRERLQVLAASSGRWSLAPRLGLVTAPS
jgi:hypothetical protein